MGGSSGSILYWTMPAHDGQRARVLGESCAAGSRLAGRLLVRPGGARDRGKTTRGEGGSAPACQREGGMVGGEISRQGEVGRLGEDMSTRRPPSVRRIVVDQSTDERGR
jgi:hypothetical protein